jgi:glycosyltransferase involved in cell wall biosynthesis
MKPVDFKNTPLPIAVVMITLNEAHNLEAILDNIQGWAEEVFIVDSYSGDETVDIAFRRGVHVVQRAFSGFGDQWNFALENLPITSKWTMKLDPDERLSDELKSAVSEAIQKDDCDGYSLTRRLWFMGKPLQVKPSLVRIWRTGRCKFSEVAVNEHPQVSGHVNSLGGYLEHHDSPNLEHWLDKQNRYTTLEADISFRGAELADKPILFGTSLQRRMWLKRYFFMLPGRYFFLFLYNWIWLGAWRAGRVGFIWSRLRSDIMRFIEYKRYEIEITGCDPFNENRTIGQPDCRVKQYD